LPGKPGSAEFLATYNRLVEATNPAKPNLSLSHPPGSVGALIDDYLASPEFRDRKPSTQRIYRRVLEPLANRIGHRAVKLIERRHVKAMRDEKADTPGMANMVVKVASTLLKFAVENDWIEHNPALGIKLFKLGEQRAWTDPECRAFEARWAAGPMQRRCYVLARCTGQRAGDLAKMVRGHRWQNADGRGFIHVKQEKTGKELDIPELQEMAAELASGEQTKAGGSAFADGDELSPWFAAAIEAARLLHGLRKLTAKTLAEAGCSPHLIGSITAQSAVAGDRALHPPGRLAGDGDGGYLKLEGNGKRTRSAKRTPGQESQTERRIYGTGVNPLLTGAA
jgi:enterobacteria phage integrase